MALAEAMKICNEMSVELDLTWEKDSKDTKLRQMVQTCLCTKFSARWKDLMVQLALEAIQIVKMMPKEVNKEEPKDNKTTPKKSSSPKKGILGNKYIGIEE